MPATSETLSRRLELVAQDPFPLTEVSVSPDLGFVYGAWGQAMTNDALIEFLLPHVPDSRSLLAEKVANAGFSVRHHDLWGRSTNINDYITTETEVGTATLTRALELQHVAPDQLSRLYVTMSGPAHPDIPYWIAESLGIERARVHRYSIACDGAAMALGDALDELSEGNFGILAVEGASKAVALGQRGVFDDVAAINFGNGAAALVADRRAFEKKADVIVVHADTHHTYSAPNNYPASLGERVRELGTLIRSGRDVFLPMPQSPDHPDRMVMKQEAARFFARLAKSAMVKLFEENYKQLNGRPSYRVVSHQPHRGIHEISNDLIIREFTKRRWPQLHNPWVMGVVGMGNCVAAVILINLAHQLQNGMLSLNEDFVLLGYGAGGSARAMILKIKG